MDWFYTAATAILILVSYIIGRSHGVSEFLSANTIGSLRVDRSDEDGPLVFMEVDPSFKYFTEMDMDVVILKVKHEDFIPRK